MKFVENPNLPRDAKTIIIGEKYAELIGESLINLGVIPLYVPLNGNVDHRLAGHADLSVLHLGGSEIALASYLKESSFAKNLAEKGLKIYFSDTFQEEKYPFDAVLNMCICSDKLIFNPKTAEKSIVDYLTIERGYNNIPVKQGYSKCSVCIVSQNAIITADEGIHKRATVAGIDSLKIQPGYIELEGFDYGFIGGASFKINNNLLAFTGHLDKHPDKNKILEFLSLHNIDAVYITDKSIFDIGSGIQIVEK